MTFTEKLAQATAGKNKSAIAKAAGLPATAISNYLNRKYAPQADTALKLARALGVPFDWLIDEEQGWPPPPVASVTALSTEELTRELSRRARGIVEAIWQKLHAAKPVNWTELASRVLETDPAKPLPAAIRKQLEIPSQLIALKRELEDFIPPVRDSVGEHSKPPIDGFSGPGMFEGATLLELFHAIERLEHAPAFVVALRLGGAWLAPEQWKNESHNFLEHVAVVREDAEKELEIIRLTEANAAAQSSRLRANYAKEQQAENKAARAKRPKT